MIAWWIYAALLGALAGGAAWALEAGLRARGLPRRWPWLAAMLVTAALPVVAAAGRLAAGPAAAGSAGAAAGAGAAASGAAVRADAVLGLAWAAASAALVLLAVVQAVLLRRVRARARPGVLDGFRILVSPRAGPALVGLWRPAILVPAWVPELAPEARRLVLLHEEEHRRAGDLWLLALAGAAVCLFPWNAALWWQAGRLRDAIELDCDRRVVRGAASPRAYGLVLLQAARRLGASGWLAAGLGASPSLLERRVRALVQPSAPGWMPAGGWALALAVLPVMALLAARAPERLPAGVPMPASRAPDARRAHQAPGPALAGARPDADPRAAAGPAAPRQAEPVRRAATDGRGLEQRRAAAAERTQAPLRPAPAAAGFADGAGGDEGSAPAAETRVAGDTGPAAPAPILDPRLRVGPAAARDPLAGRLPAAPRGPELGEVLGIGVAVQLRPSRRP